MSKLRPTGGGRSASCATFMRRTATPAAALLIGADPPVPSDWPTAEGDGTSDAELGHAVGWVCEVRANHIVLLNPLGEGVFRMPLPDLDDAWLHEVRSTASAAIYLLDHELGIELVVPGAAEAAVDAAAATGALPAATVRTAIDEAYGRQKPVGRNDPCPCGSGRKYKHCHLK